MKPNTILYLVACFLIICSIACTEEMPENPDSEAKLNFHFGSFGGLCGFRDSLTIQADFNVSYNHNEFCTDTEYENQSTLTASEYKEILNLFSRSTFSKMMLNSCDRCLDGLDTFLNIEGDNYAHRIVYARTDDISEIRDLIDRLTVLRESLKVE